MGGAGLALIWVVATSSAASETSSVAQSSSTAIEVGDVGDLPLSPEELALLSALSSGTSTVATPDRAPIWASPTFEGATSRAIDRDRLLETGGRSVSESLDSLPALGWSWRGTEQATIIYDGVELEDFTGGPAIDGWLGMHPRLLEGVSLLRPGGVGRVSSAHDGVLVLEGLAPDASLSSEAVAFLRSADRSSGLFGTVTGGAGKLAGRLSLSYADFKALRVPTTRVSEDLFGPSQRWSFAGRVDYRDQGLLIRAGADVDRLLNRQLYDSRGRRSLHEEVGQRHLVYLSGAIFGDAVAAGVVLSGQGLRRELEGAHERADAWQLRAWGRWSMFEWLDLKGGSLLSTSPSRTSVADAKEDRLEGWLGLELHTAGLIVGANTRLTNRYRSSDLLGTSAARDQLQGEVTAELTIAGPLAIAAAFRDGITFEGTGPLLGSGLGLGLEAGPRLRFESAWLELNGFFSTYTDAPIGPTTITDLEAFGLELEGAWSLGTSWTIAASGAYADVRDENDRRLGPVPSAQGLLSLRHDFSVHGAYAEAHARAGTSGIHVFTVDELASPGPFMRLGLSGGLSLGAGLTLQIAIENALDASLRLPDSVLPAAGIDLRSSLEWRY